MYPTSVKPRYLHGVDDSTAVGTAFSVEPRQLEKSTSHRKGVVQQPNGRWGAGAQIYERQTRVWLGTFSTAAAAARAYDVAALKFRGPRATPAPSPAASPSEAAFLSSRSKDDVVDMLRKHTYDEELSNFANLSHAAGPRQLLFEKVLTRSDVGRLNRLVLPKNQAEKHFRPSNPAAGGGEVVVSVIDGAGGKLWRFRYSFWSSSRNYVFTKGWSSYVKAKGLVAGDVVAFSASSSGQLYIDCSTPAAGRAAGSAVRPVRLFGVDLAGRGEGPAGL